MNDERLVKLDRMRYIKNTTSSRLALLAIVFNVLYFVSIYRSNSSFYYVVMMGASIVYNLVFMLMAFLSSEGVKNYKRSYSYLLIGLGLGQIVRIFILPMQAHAAVNKLGDVETLIMGHGQFAFVLVCLLLSAVCCFVSAAVNIIKSLQLEKHVASLAKKA